MNLRTLSFLAFFLLSLTKESLPSDITVAAVQFQARGSVEGNTSVIVEKMQECAARNIRVAVFPECAITGYDKKVINAAIAKQLRIAEKQIASACKTLQMYAIVGTPHDSNGVRYNTAAVFNPQGRLFYRYAKIQ